MTEKQLLIALDDARAHGEKIVFTNGCFDIIYAGHVGYLADTRNLGDRLILAINSDASVKRLKGEGWPINTVVRRMAVLAGLEAVDLVLYDDDTPERLLEIIKPDVLVKGGDVQVLSFFDDCSTTAIVEKIQQQSVE